MGGRHTVTTVRRVCIRIMTVHGAAVHWLGPLCGQRDPDNAEQNRTAPWPGVMKEAHHRGWEWSGHSFSIAKVSRVIVKIQSLGLS